MNVKFIFENGTFKRVAAFKIKDRWHLMWTRKNQNNILRIAELPTSLGNIKQCYYYLGDLHITTENNNSWYIPLSYTECENESVLEKLHSKEQNKKLFVRKISFSKYTKVSEMFSLINAICKKYIQSEKWNSDSDCTNEIINIKYENENIRMISNGYCYSCLEDINHNIIIYPIPMYSQSCKPISIKVRYENECICEYDNGEKYVSYGDREEDVKYTDFLEFVNELTQINNL